MITLRRRTMVGDTAMGSGLVAYSIDDKLVIAIASSALFDLTESDRVYQEQGVEAYRTHQEAKLDEPLDRGVAFPFIRRLLALNRVYAKRTPVEVVFLSRNDITTGRRLYRTARHYGLDITRGAFLSGASPYPYIPAFGASLFLTAETDDVRNAIQAGYPAGMVLPGHIADDDDGHDLCIAFDFDGVLVDDEAESVFAATNSTAAFHNHETVRRDSPHRPGPLADLLQKIAKLQEAERFRGRIGSTAGPALRVAIVTARNAPSHERIVTTIESWGIRVDQTFLLGGIDKSRVLSVLRPHIFFDDQMAHLESSADTVPCVHIPFGVRNAETADTPADKHDVEHRSGDGRPQG